jgi:hypothetical protein
MATVKLKEINMRTRIIIKYTLLITIGLIHSCKSSKQNTNSNTKNENVEEVKVSKSKCDTIGAYILANLESMKPTILNINPRFNVYTVKKDGEDYYQIEWKHIPVYDSYEINFNNAFSITLHVNSDECQLIGDRIHFYINQVGLGNLCMRYTPKGDNLYDCIYRNLWSIRVRGIACTNVLGPYGENLNKISLQCSEQ